MLGEPVAVIAEAVAQLREVDRVLHRIGRGHPLGDGRLVEHGQAEGQVGHGRDV